MAEPYFRESRIRSKCFQWKFLILPGHQERRVCSRLKLISQMFPPRIWSVSFRALWNGWVNYDRMKRLLPKRPCLLGCGYPDDSLIHYLGCSVYWNFLHTSRPSGLGLQNVERCRDNALLVSDRLRDDDVARLGIGLYAMYRTINHLRFNAKEGESYNCLKLMQLFSRKAVENHRSQYLLKPEL